MNSLIRRALAVVSVTALMASSVMAQTTVVTAPKAITTLGCYQSQGSLTEFGSYTFQTSGWCQANCTSLNHPVMAITGGLTCYCGDEIPAKDQEVDSSNCDTICGGYGQQTCGGNGYWQLYLDGLTGNVKTAANSSSSSTTSTSGSTSSSQPAVVTKPGQTVFVTDPASSSNTASSSSSGGTSKVGIAVGVVVGVIALAAIVGAVVFFLKRKRNREIEEEHRRNAAVNAFIGSKSDKSSTDQRLDPSIFNETAGRQSIGSIADERDFSRRILQVRNPDRDSKSSAMA